jgi:hypothetical protein
MVRAIWHTMPGMSNRAERVAKNEATARDVNEQIEEAHDDSPPSDYLRMLCECGYTTCERVVAITPTEYADLRRDPRRFAVIREHVIEDVEEIVAQTGRFVVVAKREGTPADVAVAEDPRD